MNSELDEFEKRCRILSQHKSLCTGESLVVPPRTQWPDAVRDEASFSAVVSGVYKLWRETWKLDIGFLLRARGDSTVAREFDQLIYELRTADQHTDNAAATARRAEWTKSACGGHPPASSDDWAACGRALVVGLNAAVACLASLAAANRTQPAFQHAWQAKYSESVQSVVTQVAADLNLNLARASRQHHEGQVERRWSKYTLRPGETAVQVIASFAERSLVSSLGRLPCDYVEILEELQVLGTKDAVAALRLAHSVAEISLAKGDAYLKLVTSTWTTLRSGRYD